MDRTIYLVRHGETQWNAEARFQGHMDSPLTETGLEQGRSIGRLLNRLITVESITGFFSSPIGRSRKTAQLIAEEMNIDSARIEFLDLLKELDIGAWQGMTREEIRKEFPGEFEKREEDKWNYRCPDGESYADLSKRVENLLSTLPNEGTLVLVSHGMINRVIRSSLLQLSEQAALSYLQSNNSIVKITGDSEQHFAV